MFQEEIHFQLSSICYHLVQILSNFESAFDTLSLNQSMKGSPPGNLSNWFHWLGCFFGLKYKRIKMEEKIDSGVTETTWACYAFFHPLSLCCSTEEDFHRLMFRKKTSKALVPVTSSAFSYHSHCFSFIQRLIYLRVCSQDYHIIIWSQTVHCETLLGKNQLFITLFIFKALGYSRVWQL